MTEIIETLYDIDGYSAEIRENGDSFRVWFEELTLGIEWKDTYNNLIKHLNKCGFYF